MEQIKINQTLQSRLAEVDLNNLPFGKIFTDHMFVADYIDGQWTNCQIRPLGPLSLHPGNTALHYGQSIFEGMKASKNEEGTPLLLRPEMHIQRLNASAARMCMPSFPTPLFHQALQQLIDLDKAWIPSSEGSALYIRPFMFATDDYLGVHPSETYKFMILLLPVGPYYDKPVNLKVEEQYIRAAAGGVGAAKTAGNYAAGLLADRKAKAEGFDQVMWLDSKEFKYVQEIGTMNIFFVIDSKVVTPNLSDTILHGITRDSIIHILKAEGYTVEERPVAIQELVEAYEAGKLNEVFGAGTAAVVSMISSLTYQGKKMTFNTEDFQIAAFAKNYISQLRSGKRQDPFNWLVPVQSKAFAI